ncbi:hypothetical protein AVEN_147038-1 [Araneus ventricosus]|uniref:Uncharacterized protein n=1 Tax=Araneus ventricosus TaxID=182803 RepID=A0A4Y2VAP3_ARAVE|nr:hypothetical protein AVEN_147038-1 [Araneus ventricosus]
MRSQRLSNQALASLVKITWGLVWLVSATASTLQPRLSPRRFSSDGDDDDVQHEVLLWMKQQSKEFYAAGCGALIERWDKCSNIGGDYVEK